MSLTIPIVAADGAQSTVTLPDPVLTTGSRTISIGQTIVLDSVLSTSNMSVSKAVLNDPSAVWKSLSIYCAAPAGQVYLVVYDSSGAGGAPGKRVAVSSLFTPVFGWNTVSLPAVAAPPGTYYLGYIASSTGFKTLQTPSGAATCYASFINFAQPPATWPAGGTVQYFLDVYATLTTTTPQPALPYPSPSLSGGVISTGLQSWSEVNNGNVIPLISGVTHLGYYRLHSGGLTNMTATLQQPTADQVWGDLLNLGIKTMVSCHPHNTSSPTSADFNALIGLVLGRYGPKGSYWTDHPTAPYIPVEVIEVGNEPNAYGIPAASYGQILVNAYNYIKTNWPTVAVAGFGLGDGNIWIGNLIGYLTTALQANPSVATSMDIFTFHPYCGQINQAWFAPDQYDTFSFGPNPTGLSTNPGARLDTHVAQIRAVLSQYGVPPSVALWNSEDGYPLAGPDKGGTGQFNTGTNATVTPTQQAAYQVRMCVLCARLGVPRAYLFTLVDADSFNAGFFTPGGTIRPQATALGQLNTLIGAAISITAVSESWGGGNPFVYQFGFGDGHVVQVAWAQTAQTATIALPAGKTTTVTDMLGNVIATTSASSYSASLSGVPIWLKSV